MFHCTATKHSTLTDIINSVLSNVRGIDPHAKIGLGFQKVDNGIIIERILLHDEDDEPCSRKMEIIMNAPQRVEWVVTNPDSKINEVGCVTTHKNLKATLVEIASAFGANLLFTDDA